MGRSILYYLVKSFGAFVRFLPLRAALALGRFIGLFVFAFDIKRRTQVYANLKTAFSKEKTPSELKKITKNVFTNYGQNLIELLRLPLMNKRSFERIVKVEGKENIDRALEKGNGCILVAMHYGSWEMASISCALMGLPYKMFVRPQDDNDRLGELLNKYRSCSGQVVLTRGAGTRDFIKALKENNVIGMVADQGGRDGVLIPFFGRTATMSSGAVRMALKMDVPICFSVIMRGKGGRHRMVIHPPIDIKKTDDVEKDIIGNLKHIVNQMEEHIRKNPSEYMWFYKIWKYSQDAGICIFFDGKTGHLRQSQAVAKQLQTALNERQIRSEVEIIRVQFKNKLLARSFSLLSLFFHPVICQGRIESLKWILTPESYKQITTVNADFIISCGSSIAGVNNLLAMDHNARSIVILKPGLLSYDRFDRVIVPRHDALENSDSAVNVVVTNGAPNLITPESLNGHVEKLYERFTHLKSKVRTKIGVFIGGDSSHVYISIDQIKVLINQLKEICREVNASMLITTSRRTPEQIDQYLLKTLKRDNCCDLLVLPNRDDVPEAVGGIMGLSDILIVSGDSISMMSEAACSGKKTIVFKPETWAKVLKFYNKHRLVIDTLSRNGYVSSTDVRHVGRAVYDLMKNKVRLKVLNDNEVILKAMRELI